MYFPEKTQALRRRLRIHVRGRPAHFAAWDVAHRGAPARDEHARRARRRPASLVRRRAGARRQGVPLPPGRRDLRHRRAVFLDVLRRRRPELRADLEPGPRLRRLHHLPPGPSRTDAPAGSRGRSRAFSRDQYLHARVWLAVAVSSSCSDRRRIRTDRDLWPCCGPPTQRPDAAAARRRAAGRGASERTRREVPEAQLDHDDHRRLRRGSSGFPARRIGNLWTSDFRGVVAAVPERASGSPPCPWAAPPAAPQRRRWRRTRPAHRCRPPRQPGKRPRRRRGERRDGEVAAGGGRGGGGGGVSERGRRVIVARRPDPPARPSEGGGGGGALPESYR